MSKVQRLAAVAILLKLLCGGAAMAGEVVEIKISGLAFTPSSVSVHKGDRVKWVNDDFIDHTVTGDTGGVDEAVAAGKTIEIAMTKPGSFSYYCRVHPNMTGTVLVLDR